jgi:redox-sensitive bicupin YhaK (pirin superfamily)
MPAVTVEDLTVLPRSPAPVPGAAARPVMSLTTAPKGYEGEGFPVRRAFAGVDLALLDPFIHMDQMGEVEYAPGEPKGTAWHPHRGFETVTYMIDGEMAHSDSNGGGGLITNGDTQWMTAGGGILHIETPPEHLVASGGLFHGFQLWVNLPAKDKMTAPRYQDIGPERIPVVHPADGVEVKVIAGSLAGATGPVEGIVTAPVYLDIGLQPGAQFTLDLPVGHHGFAYVFDGEAALVGGEQLRRSELGVLSGGEQLQLAGGDKPSRLLVVAGKPLNESVARYGPFVMNTPEQIHEAIADFRAGKF